MSKGEGKTALSHALRATHTHRVGKKAGSRKAAKTQRRMKKARRAEFFKN